MKRQYKDETRAKRIAGAAAVGIVLTSLFCEVSGASRLGCLLLDRTVWAALEALRSVILAAIWHAASLHVYQNPGLVHRAAQVGARLWPLIWAQFS